MRVRALKELRGAGRTVNVGEEFEVGGEELAGLLRSRAVEPMPRKVERAVEAQKVEKAVEAPEPLEAEAPKRAPKKRAKAKK